MHGHGKEAFTLRIGSRACPVNHILLHAWLCSVLAEFMEMWRCENVLLRKLFELESENAAGYVLLANIYAASGNRHLCEDVERQRKERGVKRQLGCTWIGVDNKVHTFVEGDQDHPQMVEIRAELKRLSGLMHDAGYVPHTTLVLQF